MVDVVDHAPRCCVRTPERNWVDLPIDHSGTLSVDMLDLRRDVSGDEGRIRRAARHAGRPSRDRTLRITKHASAVTTCEDVLSVRLIADGGSGPRRSLDASRYVATAHDLHN